MSNIILSTVGQDEEYSNPPRRSEIYSNNQIILSGIKKSFNFEIENIELIKKKNKF